MRARQEEKNKIKKVKKERNKNRNRFVKSLEFKERSKKKII